MKEKLESIKRFWIVAMLVVAAIILVVMWGRCNPRRYEEAPKVLRWKGVLTNFIVDMAVDKARSIYETMMNERQAL